MGKLDLINLLHSVYQLQDEIGKLSGNRVSSKIKNVQEELKNIVEFLEKKISLMGE